MQAKHLLLALLGFSAVESVQAATFTVTTVSDNAGAPAIGSLRWAINSANAAAGPHTIAFNIPAASLTGPFAGLRAVITLAAPLPAIGQTNVTIDGTTQTTFGGNTNAGTLGTTTTVGTDDIAIAAVACPEVELRMLTSSGAQLFSIGAAGCTLKGMALHGGSAQAIAVSGGGTGFLITECIIGTSATTYSFPADGSQCSNFGLNIPGGSGSVINSLVGFTGNSGLNVNNGYASAVLTVRGCQFNQNGYTSAGGDGVSLGDSGPAGPLLFENNLVVSSNSSALQFEIGTTSPSTVLNNTMTSCGLGGAGTATNSLEGSAICYLQRNGTKTAAQADLISKNVISSSQFSAIVIGYGQRNIRLSQNSVFLNGALSLDFNTSTAARVGNGNVYGNGDGVSGNDGVLDANGTTGNNGMDYPIITTGQLNAAGNQLTVQGYIGGASGASSTFAGTTIELFKGDDAGANQNGPTFAGDGTTVAHGEARYYLGTITADANGNFNATIAVSNMTVNSQLCATAWLPGVGTSEVSNGRLVIPPTPGANVPPVAQDVLQAPALANTLGQSPVAALVATDADGTVDAFTITALPAAASGVLYYNNGTAVVAATVGLSIPYARRGQLLFDPAAGYAGSALVSYTATDNLGAASIGNATLEIPVNAPPVANDVTHPATLDSSPATPATTNLALLQGYDPDGTVVSFIIASLPSAASGVLYYNNGSSTVAATVGMSVSYARAGQLYFQPVHNYNGSATFTYTATDNDNASSLAATFSVPVGTGNQAPTPNNVTNAAIANDGASHALQPLSGTDPDGSVAGYTIATLPNPAHGTLYFNGVAAAVGTLVPAAQANALSFRGAGVYVGNASFTYTATDDQGLVSASAATFTVPVVANAGGALPVELLHFSAATRGPDALLKWSTASEKNSAYFMVERSMDGRTFASLKQVEARGSSTAPTAYATTDAGVGAKAAGPVYYRLQEVDLDGTASYSPVVSVSFGASAASLFTLYPNPATAALALDLTALPTGTYRVLFTDMAGRTIRNTSVEAGLTHGLDLHDLASGSYLVLVQGTGTQANIHLTQRFVKE